MIKSEILNKIKENHKCKYVGFEIKDIKEILVFPIDSKIENIFLNEGVDAIYKNNKLIIPYKNIVGISFK